MVSQIDNAGLMELLKKQTRLGLAFYVVLPLGVVSSWGVAYAHIPQNLEALVEFSLIAIWFATLAYLYLKKVKIDREIAKIDPQIMRDSPLVKDYRTRNYWVNTFFALAIFSPSLTTLFMQSHTKMPIYVILQVILVIFFILYSVLSAAMRAAKEIQNDEFVTNKTRYAAYWGLMIGLFLLVSWQILLWNIPKIYLGIADKFANHAPDVLVAISISIMLLGWLFGRFIAWDRFR